MKVKTAILGAPGGRLARTQKRLVRLDQMFEWGDIEEAEYRRKVEKPRRIWPPFRSPTRSPALDDVARLVASLPAAVAVATPEQIKALVRLVVESVETCDRRVSRVVIGPGA